MRFTLDFLVTTVIPMAAGLAIGFLIGILSDITRFRPARSRESDVCTRPGHACGTEGAGPCNGLPRRP
jgi:NhaP-type Na+/H+ or K+/H+ antiporter